MGDRSAALPHELDLLVVHVDAVGEQRALVQCTGSLEAVDDPAPAASHRVSLVGRVLGGVDVESHSRGDSRVGARGQGLVREGERGVSADQATRERRLLAPDAVEEAAILGHSGPGPLRPIAVGGLVTEDGAQPEVAQRLLDDVERAVDRVGRGVVVDHGGRPGKKRLHPADEGGRPDALLVECAVEAPPDALQDLREVLRRRQRVRHPARECRVEMRVGTDVARDDETAGAVVSHDATLRGDASVDDMQLLT